MQTIQDGSFMKIDTPQQIIDDYDKMLWSVKSKEMYRLLKDLRGHQYILSSHAFGDAHHITLNQSALDHGTSFSEDDLREFLEQQNHTEIEISPIKAGIEDCFMQMIS